MSRSLQNAVPAWQVLRLVVADELNPLVRLVPQVGVDQIEYAGAVWATINQIADLDHGQIGR